MGQKRGLRKAGPGPQSGSFFLEIRRPAAFAGEPVHARAMRESALRGLHILSLTGPRLLRRRLQRAAVGESELPRQAADLVHGVEMRRRFLVGLSAGEER